MKLTTFLYTLLSLGSISKSSFGQNVNCTDSMVVINHYEEEGQGGALYTQQSTKIGRAHV